MRRCARRWCETNVAPLCLNSSESTRFNWHRICIGVEFFNFNLKFKNFNMVYGFRNPFWQWTDHPRLRTVNHKPYAWSAKYGVRFMVYGFAKIDNGRGLSIIFLCCLVSIVSMINSNYSLCRNMMVHCVRKGTMGCTYIHVLLRV